MIGPGGGVDILVGKLHGAAAIDAVELNPDMYRLLVGRPEDPDRVAVRHPARLGLEFADHSWIVHRFFHDPGLVSANRKTCPCPDA